MSVGAAGTHAGAAGVDPQLLSGEFSALKSSHPLRDCAEYLSSAAEQRPEMTVLADANI